MNEHSVIVDGQAKGQAFFRAGRWWWRRPSGATEPFGPGSGITDVLEWATKCCNGREAMAVSPSGVTVHFVDVKYEGLGKGDKL